MASVQRTGVALAIVLASLLACLMWTLNTPAEESTTRPVRPEYHEKHTHQPRQPAGNGQKHRPKKNPDDKPPPGAHPKQATTPTANQEVTGGKKRPTEPSKDTTTKTEDNTEEDQEDSKEGKGALRLHHVKPSFEEALSKIRQLGEVPEDMAVMGLNVTNKSPHSREWRVSTDLPRPPFEDPSDIPLEVVVPSPGTTYQTFHDVHFWCTGWITSNNHSILVTPHKTKRSELLSAMIPEPSPETMGVDSLGRYRYALVFCDFWSVTYLVFVVDCLPRLILSYYQLLEQHKDSSNPIYIISPGEFWVMQLLVEVLGISRDLVLLLPTHIIWEIYYPTLYASFDTLYWAPYIRENIPYGLQQLRSKVFTRYPLPTSPPAAPGGGARVLFTERSDITMPTNHSDMLQEMQKLSRESLFQTVRFEAIPVVKQLRLVGQADVLVGPTGGNLANIIFMRPGTKVVELLSHNVTSQPTDIEHLSRLVGVKYQRLLPIRDWERKLQPLFKSEDMLQAILDGVNIAKDRQPSSTTEKVLLNPGPPFIGCQNLFHLPRRRKFIGWFKYGFLIPQWDFVFKFPRQAFWKRVLKEMVILRNLTGDHIAPAKALCFYEMSLAQTIIGGALRRQNVTHRTLDTFVSALTGFHRLWTAHREWGRFFFYCDAGPKNWAMGLDQKLKMFDFDASYWVVDGVLCSKDRHCGCTLKDKGRSSACQNNRCTYAGLEKKVEALANTWLFSTFRGLWPESLKDDEASQEIWVKLRHKQLVRSDIVDYLKGLAGRFELNLCKMNLDVPECQRQRSTE